MSTPQSPTEMLNELADEVDAGNTRMERMVDQLRGGPPGRGQLDEVLASGCPECGGELRAVAAFQSLLERLMLRFAPMTETERAELERTVEIFCSECDYAGAAQR